MDGTTVLGVITTVYGIAGAMAVLLQARQVMRRHSSRDVSIRFMLLYVGGYGLYLAYGLAIGSLTLILSDAVGLACGGITLAIVVRYHTGKETAQ